MTFGGKILSIESHRGVAGLAAQISVNQAPRKLGEIKSHLNNPDISVAVRIEKARF